jgi:hypothetical protein
VTASIVGPAARVRGRVVLTAMMSRFQARPFAAGLVSFLMFITFGSIPLLVGAWIPYRWYAIGAITGVSLILLALSGTRHRTLYSLSLSHTSLLAPMCWSDERACSMRGQAPWARSLVVPTCCWARSE